MNRVKLTLLSVLALYAVDVTAQLRVDSDGLAIQEGTVFFVDGLTMTPSMKLTLNNVMLEKQPATIYWPLHNSIQRIYRFDRPISFKGDLAIDYEDRELNNNKPASLALAHAAFTTVNPDDFSIHLKSTVDLDAKRVFATIDEEIKLSDLTAITPESKIPAYIELEIHNVITPNDDGVNDTWIIKNIDRYPNNSVQIFDRDGKLVYSKLGYDNSWNGTFGGALLPEDTYYYILHLDSNQGKEKLKGYISIIREQQ